MVKKKKFDKKNSITFRLVSRSQKDPLINYEDAPQSVLEEENNKRKKEQQKYGIYYDDDYDYLQHLKDVEEVEEEYYFEEFKPKINRVKEIKFKDEIDEKDNDKIILPSSVFPSQYKESVGMLNKTALPTGLNLNWDPDIVEALNDKLNLEDENNILDDDFVIQAMGGKLETEENQQLEEKKSKKIKKKLLDDDETRTYVSCGSQSYFTNYSLTSSVIRRNEKLANLDEHFEIFFLKDLTQEKENKFCEEDDEDEKILKNLKNEEYSLNKNESNIQIDLSKEIILKLAEKQLEDDADNFEEYEEVILKLATGKNDHEDRWDCESILSTYSNIYNRPKLVFENNSKKITLNKKTGIPENVISSNLILNKTNSDAKSIKSITSLISQLFVRQKNETKEEKQLRKKTLKEYQRNRRLEKKTNKLAFKEENLRQQIESATNRQLVAINF